MGAVLQKLKGEEGGGDAAVKRQAEGFANPMYKMLDLGDFSSKNHIITKGGGLFFELSKKAKLTGNTAELDEAIRSKVRPYLYNGGAGQWIHCAHLACLRNRDRPKSKQFPQITALGDEAFNFKFEDSSLLAELIGSDTKESHPERFTEHCWNVENRGAVGETTFHVCFLMGTPTHMYCAKRMLKWFPKLLNDIYLSEEYYGENVLHMGCVAEDASLVKWLLDIGSDVHRRCYGNFFCPDDQKPHRSDAVDHEHVDVPLYTNYLGYVSWGEYPMNFAAVLNQEEIYRLILAKGGNFDLQDTNGCTVTHIMVVWDNIKMFDMATECGAAINILNRQGLTPLTMAAYLARMDMFFHIASIERDIYWQLGNVTCSAYPLRYLDTIHSDTGELQTMSALNLIVFGPKLEHLDLIEYVVVDLLKVKWQSFVRREFFKQMGIFTVFFIMSMFTYILRVGPLGTCNSAELSPDNSTQSQPMMTEVNISALVSKCPEDQDLEVVGGLGLCYLHHSHRLSQKVRLCVEIIIVLMALCFLIKAVRELGFLGRKIFLQNMMLCPSRVFFLSSCLLHQLTVPARILCLHHLDDALVQVCMLANGCYFLFFCRGFKLVGPMVIMIYRMLAQDLMRFGTIYFIFIMGFGQAYFLVFMSYENEEETNPMETAMDSVLQMFIMTLGAFGDIWDEIPFTRHKAIGKFHWFLFIALLVILLLNLLIAMMGDTYAKIAEIKNEWMRQWARTVLIVERSIPPGDRLRYQNSYCDIDTQGNKALVMKQYLSDEQVCEIGEIIEMKVTHRKNLERRKNKFGIESVSELGKNIAGAAVIVPDSSDGTAPENPYE